MTESEKDAEIVRLRERYVELLQLLGKAMHNGYLDENACSPSWLKEARRAVTPTDLDLGMFRGSRTANHLIKTRPRASWIVRFLIERRYEVNSTDKPLFRWSVDREAEFLTPLRGLARSTR